MEASERIEQLEQKVAKLEKYVIDLLFSVSHLEVQMISILDSATAKKEDKKRR